MKMSSVFVMFTGNKGLYATVKGEMEQRKDIRKKVRTREYGKNMSTGGIQGRFQVTSKEEKKNKQIKDRTEEDEWGL